MSQPVVDTLRISEALRKTGMEREKAEGLARVLGDELGDHVVARGDLQTGFLEVRGEIQSVDHRVDVARIDLVGQIRILDGRIDALDSKLTFMIAGVGLFVAAVTLANAMGFFQPAPPSAQSPVGMTPAPALVAPTVTARPQPLPDG